MRRAFGFMVLLALVACGSPESKEKAPTTPGAATKRQRPVQWMVWGNPDVPARDRKADSLACREREREGTEGRPLLWWKRWTKCMVELGWTVEKSGGA